MQIFSKLQRNSINQIFIKLLFIYFINLFSSYTVFFPVLLGFFILCEEFFSVIVFIALFSYFHLFNLIYFLLIYLIMKFFLINRLKDIIDFYYQDAIGLIIVYIMFGIYLYFFTNVSHLLLMLYLIYNYAFDLIVLRLFKCELKSF